MYLTGIGLSLLILLPIPKAEAPAPSAAFDLSLTMLAALHGADFALTRGVVSEGGREANPFMRPFAESDAALFAVKIVGVAVSHLALRRVYRENKTLAWIGSIFLNALMVAVVIHNLHE